MQSADIPLSISAQVTLSSSSPDGGATVLLCSASDPCKRRGGLFNFSSSWLLSSPPLKGSRLTPSSCRRTAGTMVAGAARVSSTGSVWGRLRAETGETDRAVTAPGRLTEEGKPGIRPSTLLLRWSVMNHSELSTWTAFVGIICEFWGWRISLLCL